MRAAVTRSGELVVDDVELPEPLDHQVVVETLACGICGSDLHCLHHAEQFVETAREGGFDRFVFDPGSDVVFGHELAGRILRPAPDGSGPAEGTPVAVMPRVSLPDGTITLGYSNSHPGGYGERFVADADACVAIPEGVDPTRAALTEPFAVGLHAVNAVGTDLPGGAIVLGCGPIGLTVVAWLAHAGVGPVIAADFSAGRRELATSLGADLAVDPSSLPAIEAWRDSGGVEETPPAIFECVGVPGMIDQAVTMAPNQTHIVIVGYCMEPDTFRPAMAINHHVTIHFVLGWTPPEFRRSLEAIATAEVDPEVLVTGEVDLAGVPGAFAELASPVEHAKILIVPGRDR